MSVSPEQIEQIFAEAQKNPGSFSDILFESTWPIMVLLPKQERINLSQRIYEWAKSITDIQPKTLAYATLNLGLVAFQNEDYENALDFSGQAQKLFFALADEDGENMSSMLTGMIYRPLGDIELSLKYLLEVYPEMIKTKTHKFFHCVTCFNMAEIYSDTNHLNESLKLYHETIEITSANDFSYIEGLATNGIAGVYVKQNKFGLGMDYYTKALDISKRIKFMPFQARVLTDIGDYYLKSGDYERAIANNKEALAIRENLDIKGGIITNLMHLGEIYFKQGKFDDARVSLDKALHSAEQMHVKTKMFAIHEILSSIFRAENNMADGFIHFKAFHDIRDEVNNEDREKKVKNLQIIFESEQTKKENHIIKAQKTEIEKKNKELQQTIDELTKTKASRRAKTITLGVAVTLFIIEEIITDLLIHPNIPADNFLIALGTNFIIVFSLRPIENAIENYLLHHRFAKKKAQKTEPAHAI